MQIFSQEGGSPADTALYVSAFFDELQRAGVRDVVISPGSRSTPLSMVAYASSLNVYLDVDERGAGFFALGIAKASGRAVCLVCTSGTALANYYPCIMEAESSRIPLMVLSGDRPLHLQKVGAPQTCNQIEVFSSHVRQFWQMPAPVATQKNIAYVRQIAREAYHMCAVGSIQAGPVHLNFPFDEPLKPDLSVEGLFEIGRVAGSDAFPVAMSAVSALAVEYKKELQHYFKNHRVIALCGEGTLGVVPSYEALNLAIEFAQAFDVPLLADPLSQLRSCSHDAVVDNYDNIIDRDTCPEFDAVVRFGRYPVSKRLSTAVQAACSKGCLQFVVDPLETRDFNATTTTLIAMEPLDFMQSMLQGLSVEQDEGAESTVTLESAATGGGAEAATKSVATVTTPYLDDWAHLNKLERSRIQAVKNPNAPVVEGSYVSALLDHIPQDSLLFVANSMSIRAVDTFYVKEDKQLRVLANRGLNGIDGTLSAALGAAQLFKQSVFLTGDLALQHDINALSLQHEMILREQQGHARPSIIVVLLNNKGGAIFDILPQRSDEPYFERLFLTPQNVDFGAAAQAFGVAHAKAKSVADFTTIFTYWLGKPGIHLLEIELPLQGVRERYASYQ